MSLRVSLGIALTIAPNITRSVARQKLVHFGQLQLVRLGSTMPVAFLSAIRIEKKKGIAFEISHRFTGLWHLMTGDRMNQTSEVLTVLFLFLEFF